MCSCSTKGGASLVIGTQAEEVEAVVAEEEEAGRGRAGRGRGDK